MATQTEFEYIVWHIDNALEALARNSAALQERPEYANVLRVHMASWKKRLRQQQGYLDELPESERPRAEYDAVIDKIRAALDGGE